MKYCYHCGAQVEESAEYCPKCGGKLTRDSQIDGNKTLGTIAKILMLVACVGIALSALITLVGAALMFTMPNIPEFEEALQAALEMANPGITIEWESAWMAASLSFALTAISMLVSLAWCIPMTVHVWKKVTNNEPVSTAMKVLVLIFVSRIAGILLLCMSEPKKEENV